MPFTNFVSYLYHKNPRSPRVGHLDVEQDVVIPLAHASGTPVSSLYEIIEVGYEDLVEVEQGVTIPLSSVTILPPLADRDVLAVGKNYREHAKEFNASGYDASDMVDMPSHPVIFTKRATSIIAHGGDVLPHPDFTKTLDYEGEIGVIIGKTGTQISESEASDYIWGYTIINDVTAREKQRDHKQFYIGKSADTFCPMGPIAVPKEHLPDEIEVRTKVNGDLRQHGSIKDLIFSVPRLIATLSEAQTFQAGDVIATGTPAGVGFGLQPPQFLKPGDTVEISIPGLGTLRNKVAQSDASPPPARQQSAFPLTNIERTRYGGLTKLRFGKEMYVHVTGPIPFVRPIVYIHGLGMSSTYWASLITSESAKRTCIAYDVEGLGLSPTSAASKITMETLVQDLSDLFLVQDLSDLFDHLDLDQATLIGHSLGGLIASMFAMRLPDKVTNLVLMGSCWSPTRSVSKNSMLDRARRARGEGMSELAAISADGILASHVKKYNPIAYMFVYNSVLHTDPEGYSKVAVALAQACQELKFGTFKKHVLILAGSGDQWSAEQISAFSEGNDLVKSIVLEGVQHCHLLEAYDKVKDILETCDY